MGYIKYSDPKIYQQGIVELVLSACEPVKYSGSYDFGQSDLASRMSTTTMNLRVKEKLGRLPPPDVLFLHRKIAGLYLLFNRLKAVIPGSQIVAPYIK